MLGRLGEIVCQPAAEMPSSIKLQVLKCLSAMLDYPVVVETFLSLSDKEVFFYSSQSMCQHVCDYECFNLLVTILLFQDISLYRKMLEVVLSNPVSLFLFLLFDLTLSPSTRPQEFSPPLLLFFKRFIFMRRWSALRSTLIKLLN